MNSAKLVKHLVYNNARSGNEQVKSFKAIIQESVYPKNPEYFSSGGMAIAVRTFKAYERSGGDKEGLIDLMLFFVECGSQFTLDYGDMDEDFYVAIEDVFEEVLEMIKESEPEVFALFEPRLRAIEEEVRRLGWGYGEQVQDLLKMSFPNFFEKEASF